MVCVRLLMHTKSLLLEKSGSISFVGAQIVALTVLNKAPGYPPQGQLTLNKCPYHLFSPFFFELLSAASRCENISLLLLTSS